MPTAATRATLRASRRGTASVSTMTSSRNPGGGPRQETVVSSHLVARPDRVDEPRVQRAPRVAGAQPAGVRACALRREAFPVRTPRGATRRRGADPRPSVSSSAPPARTRSSSACTSVAAQRHCGIEHRDDRVTVGRSGGFGAALLDAPSEPPCGLEEQLPAHRSGGVASTGVHRRRGRSSGLWRRGAPRARSAPRRAAARSRAHVPRWPAPSRRARRAHAPPARARIGSASRSSAVYSSAMQLPAPKIDRVVPPAELLEWPRARRAAAGEFARVVAGGLRRMEPYLAALRERGEQRGEQRVRSIGEASFRSEAFRLAPRIGGARARRTRVRPPTTSLRAARVARTKCTATATTTSADQRDGDVPPRRGSAEEIEERAHARARWRS